MKMVFNIKKAKRFGSTQLRQIATNKVPSIRFGGRLHRIRFNKAERAVARKVLRMRRR